MTNPDLDRLESAIDQLSVMEQLWLLERLARRIRSHIPPRPSMLGSELQAMAQDPAIQRELIEIESDFAITEHDGLEIHQ